MAGNEYQLAGGGYVEFDWQIIRRGGGFAVLIRSQYREIERPAGKLEIVRIAAERRDVALRGEYHAYVVVAFVLVEKVLASLVQRHDLAPELAGFRLHARLLASLFERGQRPFACVVGGGITQDRVCNGYRDGHALSTAQTCPDR